MNVTQVKCAIIGHPIKGETNGKKWVTFVFKILPPYKFPGDLGFDDAKVIFDSAKHILDYNPKAPKM